MSERAQEKTAASSAEEFVAGFAEAWARPTPERLLRILSPDVRLVAPLMAATVGSEAAREEFTRLFELIPDLSGRVHGWGAAGDVVFIEFSLSGTFAGRPLEWRLVDRFVVEDGLGTERVSYFDPLPLTIALARRPSGWARWWRSGLGPPLGRRRLPGARLRRR